MSESKNILLVGGGPFNVLLALLLRKKDKLASITIFESDKEKSLKRILVSGNGRANFFNDDFLRDDLENKVTSFKDYLRFFKDVDKKSFLDYLKNELNFYFYKDNEGRYYPYSNISSTLRDTLVKECKRQNIRFKIDEEVLSIDSRNKSITTSKGNYYYDKLVIGVGGEAYDRKKDSNLDLLRSLDLKLVRRSPALCPLLTKEKIYKNLNGVRVKGNLKLISKGEVLYKEDNSELLFKKDGISGIGVFSSTLFLRENSYIEFDITESQGVKLDLPSSFKVSYLEGMFNSKIIDYLRYLYKDNDISKKELIKAFTFNIKDTYDFKDAQISLGGIDLSEINDDLSLVRYKDIYVGGEVMNLHCICGGYNMGLAFISALKVSKSL